MIVERDIVYQIDLTEEEAMALRVADSLFVGDENYPGASKVADKFLRALDRALDVAGCPWPNLKDFEDDDAPQNNDGDDDGA